MKWAHRWWHSASCNIIMFTNVALNQKMYVECGGIFLEEYPQMSFWMAYGFDVIAPAGVVATRPIHGFEPRRSWQLSTPLRGWRQSLFTVRD